MDYFLCLRHLTAEALYPRNYVIRVGVPVINLHLTLLVFPREECMETDAQKFKDGNKTVDQGVAPCQQGVVHAYPSVRRNTALDVGYA